MTSIRVFDDQKRKEAKEQAKAMQGSDQPFHECIAFGRAWALVGLPAARRGHEAAKTRRELAGQSVEARRARLLRELEELEKQEESA